MANIIPDPDHEWFDGVYVGSKDENFDIPPNDLDLSALSSYLKCTGKKYNELLKNEINQFKLKRT